MSNILFLYTKRIKQIAAIELLDPIFRWACCSLVDPNLSFFFLGVLEAAESIEVGGFRHWAGRLRSKGVYFLGQSLQLQFAHLQSVHLHDPPHPQSLGMVSVVLLGVKSSSQCVHTSLL